MTTAPERQDAAELNPTIYCWIVIFAALGVWILPFPEWSFVKQVYRARTDPAQIAIVGPSTIDTVSSCDTDKRGIADMIADISGLKVVDLSLGGQHIADSVDLSAVAGANPAVADVVLPVAYPYLDDWTTPYFRKVAVYQWLAPEFPAYWAGGLTRFWSGLSAQPRRIERGYRFEGKEYPDYRTLATTIFSESKKNGACPEQLSPDPAFTKSYYWWTQVATKDFSSLSEWVPLLARDLAARRKHLLVVLLPTNFEYIKDLNPQWPGIVRSTQSAFRTNLIRRGVNVLDLAEDLPSDDFIERWAGPIDFKQSGRLQVAKRVIEKLREMSN